MVFVRLGVEIGRIVACAEIQRKRSLAATLTLNVGWLLADFRIGLQFRLSRLTRKQNQRECRQGLLAI